MINLMVYDLSQYRFLWSSQTLRLVLWYFTLYILLYLAAAGVMTIVVSSRWRMIGTPVRSRNIARFQRTREVAQSLVTVLIFTLVALFMFADARIHDRHLIYSDLTGSSWLYQSASLLFLIVLHDTYFYWTHRLLHLPTVRYLGHAVHHRSKTPTPWAAYSFSPLEALIHASFVPLFVCLIPIDSLVYGLFLIHMLVRVVILHSGGELLPPGALDHWFLKWLTSSVHHDLHHRFGRCNYGLYFTWWDRAMNTEYSRYREEFVRYTSQSSKGRSMASS